jgi:hypothetical protein
LNSAATPPEPRRCARSRKSTYVRNAPFHACVHTHAQRPVPRTALYLYLHMHMHMPMHIHLHLHMHLHLHLACARGRIATEREWRVEDLDVALTTAVLGHKPVAFRVTAHNRATGNDMTTWFTTLDADATSDDPAIRQALIDTDIERVAAAIGWDPAHTALSFGQEIQLPTFRRYV